LIGAADRKKLSWILLLALVVRAVVIVLLPDQNFPDSVSYRTAAQEFRHLQLMANNNIMPLYSLLIAVVGAGWGQKLADLALSLMSVWLLYEIALRIYRNGAIALAAALFCALWPHFAFFAAVGLTETLFVALVLAAFLCLYDRRFVLASVFLVLGVLTRPAIELLAPVLVLFFSLVLHRERSALAARRIIAYLAVYVALMSPWWVYNYARYGQFVRLDLASGLVLYTGNNPLNTNGGGVSKGPTQDVDLSASRRIADPILLDKTLRDAAIHYIASDPAHFIAMMPLKFARLWRPWPYAGEYSSSLVVLISVLSAVPAFLLALFGLAVTRGANLVRLLPCLGYLGYLTLVHMITFGSVRYRIPLEPFVLILSAAGFVELIQRVPLGRQLLAVISPARTR
jgi:4-amino-4-deoxy-L-arabinose transferase-like glycosyltransferase